eukprot:TRINITY_DN92863_c0_g1_i1.p1 TRINITY_DN92863_c0_g1~~TRINITY_DN92863_c0_g1_i1.p1  ORF type:complete len:607 (+),score=123.48 TRINITY_DN92863_c0_g1_i1:20-1840(+)
MAFSEPMPGDLLAIPEDAICPISQQIMEDPVVCADGHSYERSFIQRWLALGRRSSPKTNMNLAHTTLIPNLNLRNIIQQIQARMPAIQTEQMRHLKEMQDLEAIVRSLMEDQGKLAIDCIAPPPAPGSQRPSVTSVPVASSSSDVLATQQAEGSPPPVAPSPPPPPAGHGSGPVPALLDLLKHDSTQVCKSALGTIEGLVNADPLHRTSVWQNGGIPLVVGLLREGVPEQLQSACALLCTLASHQAEAQMAVAWAGAIPLLVDQLSHDSGKVRVAAARTLWSLAEGNLDNQNTMVQSGIIKCLVPLLSGGSNVEGREPTLNLLTKLALRDKLNQDSITRAGAVQPLIDLLKDEQMREPAATMLGALAHEHVDNQTAIGSAVGAIPQLIHLLSADFSGIRESAGSLLLALVWENHTKNMAAIAKGGAIRPLVDLLKDEMPGPREQAAGVLSFLATNVDNRVAIAKVGAIPTFIALLTDQEAAGARAHSAYALGNLAVMNSSNKEAIAKAGGIQALVTLLTDSLPQARERAAGALSSLCVLSDQNKTSMVRAGAIPHLIDLLHDDVTRKAAVAVLRSLADDSESHKYAIKQAASEKGCDLIAAGCKIR